jgi:hypothetical protein
MLVVSSRTADEFSSEPHLSTQVGNSNGALQHVRGTAGKVTPAIEACRSAR